MIAIGIAKHEGCSLFHQKGFDTFAERIPIADQILISKMNVVMRVGVVQNAYEKIYEIMAFYKDKIVESDHLLLEIARRRLPRMKFDNIDNIDNIDVLIIDQICKNVSGDGKDHNVAGRRFMLGFENDFHCKKMFIRGLSDKSHNNACGL